MARKTAETQRGPGVKDEDARGIVITKLKRGEGGRNTRGFGKDGNLRGGGLEGNKNKEGGGGDPR